MDQERSRSVSRHLPFNRRMVAKRRGCRRERCENWWGGGAAALVLRVVDDVGYLARLQARIHRVQNGTHSRDTEIEFEVSVAVDGDSAHPIPGPHPEPRERVCKLLASQSSVLVGVPEGSRFEFMSTWP